MMVRDVKRPLPVSMPQAARPDLASDSESCDAGSNSLSANVRQWSTGPGAKVIGWWWVCWSVVVSAACHPIRPYPQPPLAEMSSAAATDISQLDLTRLVQYASPDLRIVPGDVLRLSIEAGPQLEEASSVALRVRDDGTVAVPLVGPVKVAGWTLSDAERVVRDASIERGIYRDPQITLVREQREVRRITVVGAVAEPGVKEIPVGESHLLSALVHAGGLADDAAAVVRLRRPSAGGLYERIDLRDPQRVRDIRLADGDVVMVERRSPASVYVMGLVKRPQEIELPPGKSLRLLDAIAAAGGRRLQIADKVNIIRYDEGKEEPTVIETSIKDAKRSARGNVVLAAGDVVSVEETPLTFVVEMLQNFVRFGFSSAIPFF